MRPDLRLLVYRKVKGSKSPFPKRFWTLLASQAVVDRIILRIAMRIVGNEDDLPPIRAIDSFWMAVAHVETFLAGVRLS